MWQILILFDRNVKATWITDFPNAPNTGKNGTKTSRYNHMTKLPGQKIKRDSMSKDQTWTNLVYLEGWPKK